MSLLIHELDPDAVLTIECSDGTKSIKIESVAITPTDNDLDYIQKSAEQMHFCSFIVIDLIKEGNFTINFLSAKVICKVTALKEDRPYTWAAVKIFKLNLPDSGSHHVIFSNSDVNTFNRRQDYRLWLGIEATVSINESSVPKNILLKDISENGVGFIADTEYEIHVGNKVKVQFYDQFKTQTGEWRETLYNIHAVVVRVEAMLNGKVIIGCRMIEKGDALSKFIFAKQRQKLSLGGKNELYQRKADTILALQGAIKNEEG